MIGALSILTYICLALGVIGVGVSVFLWFKLDVLKVWNDYTGKTAEKELDELKTHKKPLSAKGKYKQNNVPDKNRASAEELDQIWSESKVLSGTDEVDTFYDSEENEATEAMAKIVRDEPEDLEGSTEALIRPEEDTEVLFGPRTAVLTQMVPETMVMPEEDGAAHSGQEPDGSINEGTEELAMENAEMYNGIPDVNLASQTFVLIDEEQTMPIADEERIVL